MQIINPATNTPITDIPEDNQETLREKFERLQEARANWKKRGLSARTGILAAFNGLLQTHLESLAAILTAEVGKPLQQSRNEINGASARIRWMLENGERYLSEEVVTSDGATQEVIRYEPLGVVCNISAWNYPYLVGVNIFVPALLAGNTVLYKPSEYATLTGLEILRLLAQAGVPADVFQVGIGGPTVGRFLMDLPFDGYFFTGSYRTGRQVYERAAAKMVPCHCELGGKDPLYVADDIADVAAVAVATADGAFYNNGQSCCSVERIYVHERVYDDYVEKLLAEVSSWKVGAPTEDGVYIGPLTRAAQVAALTAQVEDAVEKGARVLTGGQRLEGNGNYFQPTLLVDVDHRMEVMKEESFGPVIGVMKVRDDEEAIRLMQDTDYGLTASVYSSDQDRAESILEKIDAGTGYWNCCDRVSASLPWSGRKHSGFGVALSHAGLRSFVKPKAYHLRKE